MIETKEKNKQTMFDTVMKQFNQTADLIDLDPSIRKILGITNNEIIVHFPVKMEMGK